MPAPPRRKPRAGFEPAELDVTIARGATFNTTVNLQATADTRDAYLARIHERHIWGWSVGGVGIAAVITGAVLLITGRSALDSANANPTFVKGSHKVCDSPTRSTRRSAWPCTTPRPNAWTTQTTASWPATSWVGVGVAAAVVGAVVLLTGDDPARYDRKSASSGRPTLLGWATGSSGGLMLLGRF